MPEKKAAPDFSASDMHTSLSEFHIIEKYFAHLAPDRDDVVLGIGDDCALLQPPQDQHLAVTMDTLVAGRHFTPDVDPESLGHKVLAVNLSDLAAMGATPAWATLALTLPKVDPVWLRAFADGFSRLAQSHQVSLVGGDTTRGPLAITVQVQGFLNRNQALRRSGAAPGELVYVTGSLGDAAMALRTADCSEETKRRLDWPQPRISQGQALLDLATSAIDISDGLLADLGHICNGSNVGATLYCGKLPLSPEVSRYIERSGDWSVALGGGDDYELCFTVPEKRQQQVEQLFRKNSWPLSLIGIIRGDGGIDALLEDGRTYQSPRNGFDHFSSDV